MAKAKSGLGPFVWVALTALGLVALVLALQLIADPDPPAPVDTEQTLIEPESKTAALPPPRTVRKTPVPVRAVAPVDAGHHMISGRGPVQDLGKLRPGLALYREQSEEDHENLGDSAFADMNRLWKEGRFGGHSEQGFKSLETLIDKYGDSHRADCARYLLARGRLGHGSEDILQRRERAQKLLEPMLEADNDTRCEQGAQASNMSRLLLATQVYRYEDWDRSLQVLEDLSQAPEDQVDDMGMSLAKRAQNILQQVEDEKK